MAALAGWTSVAVPSWMMTCTAAAAVGPGYWATAALALERRAPSSWLTTMTTLLPPPASSASAACGAPTRPVTTTRTAVAIRRHIMGPFVPPATVAIRSKHAQLREVAGPGRRHRRRGPDRLRPRLPHRQRRHARPR